MGILSHKGSLNIPEKLTRKLLVRYLIFMSKVQNIKQKRGYHFEKKKTLDRTYPKQYRVDSDEVFFLIDFIN